MVASYRLSVVGRLLGYVAAGLVLSAGARAGESVELVFGDPDFPRALKISAAGSEEIAVPASTPLGSLWKLFVYAYLADGSRKEPEYRCTGRNPAEEAYCCAPGESIGRDEALAKSCGLYFAPHRLAIGPADWRSYWTRQATGLPAWLLDLESVQPATEVPLPSLLVALRAIDGTARQHALIALQRVSLTPRARPLLSHLGNSLRIKTWSWHDSTGRRIGGFAGWQTDGTPVWLRGTGTSASVIEDASPWLAGMLPQVAPPEDACVRVRFFARYALSEVQLDGQHAAPGPLRGAVVVRFRNGQHLSFDSPGDLTLDRTGEHLRIEGRFGLNDYIARVIQREATARPAAAARALGVAARTYLARHAGHRGGCYEMDDDSRSQRVSPARPGNDALAAARWSDGLLLNGATGRYHLTQGGPGQLAWRDAVKWAGEGLRWDGILERAYGGAGFGLVGESDAGECHPLAAAETWLTRRQSVWERRLGGLAGFESPPSALRICRLDHGNPYADIDRNRIYATGIGSANERLTLAHEYLHFAFANHPGGRDEGFIERTARTLLETP